MQAFTAPATVKAVAASVERAFRVRHPPLALEVERPQAGFASWYELFPRSHGRRCNRHGTFDDVIGRLPGIRAMGFDVLYFPPIHPIGTHEPQGPQQHPRRRRRTIPAAPMRSAARRAGTTPSIPSSARSRTSAARRGGARERAGDRARLRRSSARPTIPGCKEHPDWFDWRPDGTIRYAENPPKKYEDIVNVDFYGRGDAGPVDRAARRRAVLGRQGVRIFRVDNPHTKPLPFWEWMIADIRARHPDVVFLSEAFTRPKVMYRLAKIGFSQSYTYFTWRNTKQELTEYLTELTHDRRRRNSSGRISSSTRPTSIRTSCRPRAAPGFLIRAALATTLSGPVGHVYRLRALRGRAAAGPRGISRLARSTRSAFGTGMRPGNIIAEITRLNRIRREPIPRCSRHLGVTFYNAFNDQILLYGKRRRDGEDMILVARQPRSAQRAGGDIRDSALGVGLPDHGSLAVEDLMRGTRFDLDTASSSTIRLDPADLPFAIWRVTPRRRSAQ